MSASIDSHGSGSVLRQFVRATQRTISEIDALFDRVHFTRPEFDLDELGDKAIITVENEGRTIRARSAMPGKDTQWVGPSAANSEIWPRFGRFHSAIDKSRFIDYVYNFKYVLYDLKTGAFRAIDADEVDNLLRRKIKIPLALRVLAGR